MRKSEEKLLKNLIETPSPSGYEEDLAKLIYKELLNYMPRTKVSIDFHNNVVAKIEGKTDKKIIIDAHLDMLGFLVYNVDKEGYISLTSIGGHDLSLLRGRKVLVLSSKTKKPIEGVIGTKHAHLIDDDNEDDQIPNRTTDITLDIGVRKIRQVLKYVSIGDPVIIKPDFNNIIEDFYSGAGFDDKAGGYILMQTIKEIRRKRQKPMANLYFTFSSQEEIGWRGAKELARRYKPDLFIGFDVTCASDCYEVDERETGRCELGKGIVVTRGVNIHRPSLKLLQSIARNNKIRIQTQATNGEEGFNADEIATMNDGIRVLNFGIPCRNLHSPVEIVSAKDLNYGIRLLKGFLLSKKLIKVIEK